MKTRLLSSAALLFLCATLHVAAQVPQILNYQGKIAVGSTPFTGTGEFRFALVSADGSTTYWSHDGTSTGGSEPTAAVSLPVVNGLYLAPLGDTAISGMSALPASVFANSGVHLRVWFDDGVNGSFHLAPDQRLAAVAYAMMADTVPDGAITSAKIAPGAVGASQLAADAVTRALNNAGLSGVAGGGMVLSLTENNTALTDAGYVPTGDVVMSKEQWRRIETNGVNYESSGVWTGTEIIFWGGYVDGGVPQDEGEGVRYNPATATWTPVSTVNAPAARLNHTAFWTGTEMIVWGGDDFEGRSWNGGRYNPATDTWTPISMDNAPTARSFYGIVWTGNEMILWGGANYEFQFPEGYFMAVDQADGARYNPATDTWTPISEVDAPSARRNFATVWTGTELILLGGVSGGARHPDIGAPQPDSRNEIWRYDPATDVWVSGSLDSAPEFGYLSKLGREDAVVVWAGEKILCLYGNYVSLYSPETDSWTRTRLMEGLGIRYRPSVVWTGSHVIVWGGMGEGGAPTFNSGFIYNPASDTWAPITAWAVEGRSYNPTVWTGKEMFVWGGYGGEGGGADMEFMDAFKPGSVMHPYVRP